MAGLDDPIDHASTTRPRAGMVWKDKRETPGLVVLVVSVATMVGFMTAAALGNAGWAAGAGGGRAARRTRGGSPRCPAGLQQGRPRASWGPHRNGAPLRGRK